MVSCIQAEYLCCYVFAPDGLLVCDQAFRLLNLGVLLCVIVHVVSEITLYALLFKHHRRSTIVLCILFPLKNVSPQVEKTGCVQNIYYCNCVLCLY